MQTKSKSLSSEFQNFPIFSYVNSRSRRFQQQFNYMEAQYPQPGVQPINFNQMNPQDLWTYQNGFQNNQFYYGCFEPQQYPEIPCSSSDSRIFPEDGKTRIEETGVEESEAVDELSQILVECLKKADIRTQEVLLRKFFFEIEKEIPLERFLVDRIKHSKINSLSEKIPGCSQETGKEITTREVDASSAPEEETSEKLERFKVKTVQVGEIVKEEAG